MVGFSAGANTAVRQYAGKSETKVVAMGSPTRGALFKNDSNVTYVQNKRDPIAMLGKITEAIQNPAKSIINFFRGKSSSKSQTYSGGDDRYDPHSSHEAFDAWEED